MLLREIDTEFSKRKIFHYGANGNKVVRHYFEMQHVTGVLYKGRTEPETEYTGGREMQCDLYVVFPETNTGLILEKGVRLCRVEPDYERSDEVKESEKQYNDFLDSIRNTDNMEKVLTESGFDSLEHYLERLRRLRDNGKWIGLLEIEFVRQVDEAFADELAAYRLEYKAKRAERDAARRKELQKQEDERRAQQNAEAERQIREAERILREGGTLTNSVVTFWQDVSGCRQYAMVNYLMRKHGVGVPLRTQGWIARSMTDCTIKNGRCVSCFFRARNKSRRGSQAIFQYMNVLIAAVQKAGKECGQNVLGDDQE